MGKKSRAKRHDEKMRKRRAEKAARKARYAAEAGTSKKKKRQVRKSPISGIYKHAHIMGDCGNPGCSSCYPKLNMYA